MKRGFFGLKWLGWLVLAGVLVACGDNSPAVSPATTSATTTTATTASSATVPASATTIAATTATLATATSPATTTPAITTAAATSVPATTSTTAPASSQTDEAARGLAIFKQQGCASCHGGDKAVGALGPALNNINFPEAGLLRQVRSGAAPMPAFSPAKLSDTDVHLIYVYLTSLKNQK